VNLVLMIWTSLCASDFWMEK